jgi:hypothetical protein
LRVVVEERNMIGLWANVAVPGNVRLRKDELRGQNEVIMRWNRRKEVEEELEEGEVVNRTFSHLNGSGNYEKVVELYFVRLFIKFGTSIRN